MSKKGTQPRSRKRQIRQYESEELALQSLSLIAAPNPKDDLSDAELAAYFKKNHITPTVVHQIIDAVRSL